MSRHRIASRVAAAPTGAYSPAIESGHHVFVSSQYGVTSSGILAGDSFAEQARSAIGNLQAQLTAGGLRLDAVVKLTVYVTDLADEVALDTIVEEAFAAPLPARSVVQVAGLPLGARIGIEAIAERYSTW
jgi:2-iminobutanoate/2-iminopropanoate deaminase